MGRQGAEVPADDVQPDLDELLRPDSTVENRLLERLCHPSTVIGNQLLEKLGLTNWPQPADRWENPVPELPGG
jgi:hypothetical protein